MSLFNSDPGSQLQRYSVASIYVNSSLLIEETSINIDRDTNSQSIHTIGNAYAGEAFGSAMIEISVDNAIPSSNFELDPGRFIGTMQPIMFSVFAGNKSITFNGFITSDNFQHAVNSVAKLSFKAKGKFTNWI